MKPVEIVTSEERAVWLERQTELRKHNLVKCNYYPNKLDEWAEKSKEIMREYNFQLQEMNKNRKEDLGLIDKDDLDSWISSKKQSNG